MATPSSESSISVHREYFPGNDPSQTGIVVETTVLKGGAYMFWAGMCASEEEKDGAVERGRLARDWACAMPPSGTTGVSTGTALFRTASDAALSMACRLATRLNSQVFVGLDVESRLVMLAEKRIVASLAQL
ncbi:hypothetical protein B0H19DRAFT_1093812 [Mycena capillaripes]|nr:hypothetical protein B0H19DRAFT_1093812 [Mycena capillaripes]